MEGLCQFHKYGFCKLKVECQNRHVQEECTTGLHCKSIKTCALRHPKMSRRIVFRFGEKCAYKHKLIITSQSLDNHEIHEDDKNLMLEVDIIKNIMNTLVSKRVKGELLENSVKGLKEFFFK